MEKNEKIIIAQSRNFGDIISDTFTLIRHGFKPLGKALLYVTGPIILFISVIIGLINSETMSLMFDDSLMNPDAVNQSANYIDNWYLKNAIFMGVGYLLIPVLSFLVMVLMQAFTYEYMDLYRKKDFKDITYQDVISGAKKHGVRLFFTNIGMLIILSIGISIFVGLFIISITAAVSGEASGLAILPVLMLAIMTLGIYIAIMIILIPPLRVFEPIGFWKSLSRSFKLMFGNFWSTFGLLFILIIIISFLGTIFMIPYMAIVMFMGFHAITNQLANMAYIKPLMVASTSLIGLSTFLYVIPFISIGLKYFSRKEEKEGEGLMNRIDSLDHGDSQLEQ